MPEMKNFFHSKLLLSICVMSLVINNITIGYGLTKYMNVMAIEFSGITQENLEACPWVVNNSKNELLGFNEEFRAYFKNDMQNELAKYPFVFVQDDSIEEIRYTGFRHEFKPMSQRGVKEEYFEDEYPIEYDPLEFDPYYCVVWFQLTQNLTARDDYTTTIARALESTFTQKWYIDQVKIPITTSTSDPTLLVVVTGLIVLVLVGLVGLVGITILRKKSG